ncbi:MAG: hypothetical protein WC303_02965 [Candidatus Paceibacterota bacterium]|jgi:hypothetical protein
MATQRVKLFRTVGKDQQVIEDEMNDFLSKDCVEKAISVGFSKARETRESCYGDEIMAAILYEPKK